MRGSCLRDWCGSRQPDSPASKRAGGLPNHRLTRIIHKVDKLCFLPGQEGIGTNYVSSDCVHRVGPPYPQTHSSREASRIGLPESSCTVERQRVAAAENLAADLFVVVEIWPAR